MDDLLEGEATSIHPSLSVTRGGVGGIEGNLDDTDDAEEEDNNPSSCQPSPLLLLAIAEEEEGDDEAEAICSSVSIAPGPESSRCLGAERARTRSRFLLCGTLFEGCSTPIHPSLSLPKYTGGGVERGERVALSSSRNIGSTGLGLVLSEDDADDRLERNRFTSTRVFDAEPFRRGCSSCKKAGKRVEECIRDLGVASSSSVSTLVKKP